MGNGRLRISKPPRSAHLQSGGRKTRSNRVQRKKFVKGHHFHFPCELICFQEMGKKNQHPHNGDQTSPSGPVPPDWELQSRSQTPGDPPAHCPSCPGPLYPLHPEALWVTSAHCPEIPGEHTNTDSHGNRIKSNHPNN